MNKSVRRYDLMCLCLFLFVANLVTAQTTGVERSRADGAGRPRHHDIAEAVRQLEAMPVKPEASGDAWNTQLAPLLDEILSAPEATSEEKATALLAAADSCPERSIPKLIDDMAKVCSAYPEEGLRANLEMKRVLLLDRVDPATAMRRLQQLADDRNEKVASIARGEVRRRALKDSPLDLRFTALDGRQVDLGAWRGKIVVVDIWATWCAPCVKEMPQVLAAYRKYHPSGFEVVGISLDKDRTALEQFIKQKSVPWPQYFQGTSPRNEFVDRFGITGIPQMWLLNKEGKVVSFSVREHFAEEIEKVFSGK